MRFNPGGTRAVWSIVNARAGGSSRTLWFCRGFGFIGALVFAGAAGLPAGDQRSVWAERCVWTFAGQRVFL